MKEEWLFPNAAVPVDTQTTLALLVEIKRLIDVVGGMALAQTIAEEHFAKFDSAINLAVDKATSRLLRMPNLGQKALNEIKEGLSAKGLKLKEKNT